MQRVSDQSRSGLWFSFSLAILLLPGCSLIQTDTPVAPGVYHWQQVAQTLSSRTHWRILGKIGIRTPEESMSAAINEWTQHDDMYDVHLSSTFLGLGAARLSGNQHYVILEESGNEPIASDQPDLLIAQQLGFPLPVAHLKHWLKGLPAPGEHHISSRTTSGLPAQMQQFGWRLEFSKHQDVNGLPLPGKIKLQREQVRIILAMREWTLL